MKEFLKKLWKEHGGTVLLVEGTLTAVAGIYGMICGHEYNTIRTIDKAIPWEKLENVDDKEKE